MAVTAGLETLATVDLLISQGSDNLYTFRYSETVDNVRIPVDLTAHAARAQIRSKVGGDLWLELTDITLAADGTIEVRIPHAITEGDAWNVRRSGVWDLELTDPDGLKVRFASGRVTVSPNVTRLA